MPVTLPAEESYSDVESLWIATEPGGMFPMGQDSFWGQARKVFCDYMQTNLFDKLAVYWNNLDPATCDADDIANYEIMLGIPVDTSKSLDSRRAFVQIRMERGAFTRSRRARVVEYFVLATEGTPITFVPEGVPFTADGIPFYAGDFDVADAYNIVEDVSGFAYAVRIRDDVDVDVSGLTRELLRITPSPIDDGMTVDLVHDPFMDKTGVLTVSGNEITDATRATNIQGDGLSNDSSFGIWEATTNLCNNGGFETNTNGWAPGGANTIARSQAVTAKFGSWCALCTKNSGVGGDGNCGEISLTLTAAAYTASAWLWVPSAYTGTLVEISAELFTGATGTLTALADMSKRDQWQRVSMTFTPVAGDLAGYLVFRTATDAPVGSFFYADGVQVEQQSFATPYVHTDGAAATRNAARVRVPAAVLNATQFWVAFRIRYGWNTADRVGEFPWLFEWRTDINSRISVAYLPSTSQWKIIEMLTGTQVGVQLDAAPAVKNDETTLVFQVTPTQLKGSVDGAAFASAARGGLLAPSGAMFDIGTIAGSGANVFDGDVLWFACGTGALTDTDAAMIYALGDTEPKYADFPEAASVTAIIPFDDDNYFVPL